MEAIQHGRLINFDFIIYSYWKFKLLDKLKYYEKYWYLPLHRNIPHIKIQNMVSKSRHLILHVFWNEIYMINFAIYSFFWIL